MRKLLFATSIAALALAPCGAFAENEPAPPAQNPAAPDAAQGDVRPAEPAPAKPALSAEDMAVAAQLRDLIESKLGRHVPHQQDRAAIEALYRQRDFAPFWVSAGKPLPRVQQVADVLRGVAADGLNPADYPTPGFAIADPSRRAADELALTSAVAAFVRHASTGRVAFTRVSGSIYFDVKAPDLTEVLEKIAAGAAARATLESLHPRHAHYRALKAELAAARRANDVARVDVIVANMERWRWLPHDLAATHVMVNVPDYGLSVVDQGKPVWSTRIVVGKPGNYATPLMTETMKYITVNPTWNVPPSIIRNEYLPALARDPGALARTGLRVGRNSDGSVRVYQPPGERNALGRLRFNFPNRFLVYQHDTPQKHLFAMSARAFSHGCMRVQNPERYAEVLLSLSQPQDGYTINRIRALYGTDERTVSLKSQIPVYVTYQTAFVDDAGRLQTRSDIYGLDKEITNLLKRDSEVADVPIARNYSSGNEPVQLYMASRLRGRAARTADEPFAGESGWAPRYSPSPRNIEFSRHQVW